MFNRFKKKAKTEEVAEPKRDPARVWERLKKKERLSLEDKAELVASHMIPAGKVLVSSDGVAMDSADGLNVKSVFVGNINDIVLGWFGQHGSIGEFTSAMIAQHWLVDKACSMPAFDAVRNGWDYNIINPEQGEGKEAAEALEKLDRKRGIKADLTKALTEARILGGKLLIFKVASDDPMYYELPFDPEKVKLGSYRGFVQVNPEHCVPGVTSLDMQDPTRPRYMQPTYWVVNGKKYHHTHCVELVPFPVTERIRPQYYYFGKSLPQMIYNRVYAAERTADEAPMLALTKRLRILLTDIEALKQDGTMQARLEAMTEYVNNFGMLIGDSYAKEAFQQMDTSLSDFDALIMSQYQLVASIADVPATRLLGTQPKGFNATGEHEAENYRLNLETQQELLLSPILHKHAELARLSLGIKCEAVEVSWRALSSPTAEEWANINKIKSETAKNYWDMGAVSDAEVRQALQADTESDFNFISDLDESAEAL